MGKSIVSVITVTFNSAKTVADTMRSVASQSYPFIEHIIIDGASNDGTVEIVRSLMTSDSKLVSEPDSGLYHGMNKGIRIASGDIIGFLNSDDVFTNENIIQTVVESFDDLEVNSVYGDVQFVNPKKAGKIVRYYSSEKFMPNAFKYGFMPAHPSFYTRKSIYDLIGLFKEDYKIAADFELLIRFFKCDSIRPKYIPIPFVTMNTGGISNKSIKNRLLINKEIFRACKENGIVTNYFYIYSRYLRKIHEFS
mgnify:CR=1 FL=1|jgi:glycosyltransferase involved in cell wall biosynthesis